MKDAAENSINEILGYVITRTEGGKTYYLTLFFEWKEFKKLNETHLHESLDNALSFIADPEWPGPPPQEIIEASRVHNFTAEICRFGFTTNTSEYPEIGFLVATP